MSFCLFFGQKFWRGWRACRHSRDPLALQKHKRNNPFSKNIARCAVHWELWLAEIMLQQEQGGIDWRGQGMPNRSQQKSLNPKRLVTWLTGKSSFIVGRYIDSNGWFFLVRFPWILSFFELLIKVQKSGSTSWDVLVNWCFPGFLNHQQHCWWKISCTGWYGKYPMICRVSYKSGGAGFFLSTVVLIMRPPGK